MFALGQVLVDVWRVRDIWIIIINIYWPNNTNILYAWHIIDTTATYIAELMLPRNDGGFWCVDTPVFGRWETPVQLRLV